MKRWQMIKLGLILAVYTIVGCVGLALVYNSTSKTIAQRQEADLQAGLREVFPKATGFTLRVGKGTVKSPNPKIIFGAAYTANGPSGPLGIAVKVAGSSYGGTTTLLVGVSTDKTITGVKILENKDTPGLGGNAASSTYYVDKATKMTFPGQFAGKKLTDGFVVKKDVIAITSATISPSPAQPLRADPLPIWFRSSARPCPTPSALEARRRPPRHRAAALSFRRPTASG